MAYVELITNSTEQITVRLGGLSLGWDDDVNGPREIEWYIGSTSYGIDYELYEGMEFSNEFTLEWSILGQKYTVYAIVRKSWTNEPVATIYSDEITPASPEVSVVDLSSNSITAKLIGLDSEASYVGKHIAWFIGGSYKGETYDLGGITESGEITIDGLSPDTAYTITAGIIDGNNSILESFSYNFRTTETTTSPEICIVDLSSTSITVRLIGLDPNASYSNKHIAWYIGDTNKGTCDLDDNYNSESGDITIDDLKPNTAYTITANIADDNSYNTLESFSCDFKTTETTVESWTDLHVSTLSGINKGELKRKHAEIKPYELHFYELSFNEDGKAEFAVIKSDASDDFVVEGYLLSTCNYDTSSGIPSDLLSLDDYNQASNGFGFTYNVEKETVYYLCVKSDDVKETGSYTFAVYFKGDDEKPSCTLNCQWKSNYILTASNFPTLSGTNHSLKCYTYPYIKAQDFNQFCSDINAVRLKSGTYEVAFTEVKQDDPMRADLWNDIIGAIYTIHDDYPDSRDRVSSNYEITKDFIEQLETDLKAIRDLVYE